MNLDLGGLRTKLIPQPWSPSPAMNGFVAYCKQTLSPLWGKKRVSGWKQNNSPESFSPFFCLHLPSLVSSSTFFLVIKFHSSPLTSHTHRAAKGMGGVVSFFLFLFTYFLSLSYFCLDSNYLWHAKYALGCHHEWVPNAVRAYFHPTTYSYSRRVLWVP